jgi:hypothetical protein
MRRFCAGLIAKLCRSTTLRQVPRGDSSGVQFSQWGVGTVARDSLIRLMRPGETRVQVRADGGSGLFDLSQGS